MSSRAGVEAQATWVVTFPPCDPPCVFFVITPRDQVGIRTQPCRAKDMSQRCYLWEPQIWHPQPQGPPSTAGVIFTVGDPPPKTEHGPSNPQTTFSPTALVSCSQGSREARRHKDGSFACRGFQVQTLPSALDPFSAPTSPLPDLVPACSYLFLSLSM